MILNLFMFLLQNYWVRCCLRSISLPLWYSLLASRGRVFNCGNLYWVFKEVEGVDRRVCPFIVRGFCFLTEEQKNRRTKYFFCFGWACRMRNYATKNCVDICQGENSFSHCHISTQFKLEIYDFRALTHAKGSKKLMVWCVACGSCFKILCNQRNVGLCTSV